MVGFIPAVGHDDHIAGEIRQQGQQVHLQLIPQVAVDGRERLVQQQGLGPGDQHPGQRHALGLPARKLGRAAVVQPLQLEQMDGVLKGGLLFGGVFFPAQAR